MKIKLINKTDEVLNLNDVGLSLQPLSTKEIDVASSGLNQSRTILKYISETKIVVNDYSRDLLPTEGIILISEGLLLPKNPDGKLYVQQTSRIPGTMTYWTGRGDDPTDVTDVGNGQQFEIQHESGDSGEQSIYLDFNNIDNITNLHEGYFIWQNAEFGDCITLESVVNTVSIEAGTNTNYNLYGGFLVIPAAGDGTINVTSDITNPNISGGSLVEVYTNELGYRPPAYWDADYNSTTHLFENIRPNLTASGQFNMYTVELKGNRFVNSIPVLNNGFEMLQSSDSTFFPHGIRIKATILTRDVNHTWNFGGILTLHREKTV